MPTRRSPGLTSSASYSSGCMKKVYRYETRQDLTLLGSRMDAASHCSRCLPSIPEMSWMGGAEVVEITQRRVRRLRLVPGPDAVGALASLARDLDTMAEQGMVHGDLNRKNILWTEDGYRVVDIEPLLRIRCADGRTVLRGTAPYLHPDDLERSRISTLSDRLGFACMVEWVRGRVNRPAEAALRLASHVLDRSFAALAG